MTLREVLVALAVIAATVIATLSLIAVLDHQAEGKVGYDCVDPTERERIRQLVFDGVDKGLVEFDGASV